VLDAAGATRSATSGCLRFGAGTARHRAHGTDPGTSVVDGPNKAHDVPNLFVVDGSSMPTSAAVNPTHTIQAIALRAATDLEKRRDWSFLARDAAKSPRRIFGAHAARSGAQLLRCSLTQFYNALAPLLGASPASQPPGSPNLSPRFSAAPS